MLTVMMAIVAASWASPMMRLPHDVPVRAPAAARVPEGVPVAEGVPLLPEGVSRWEGSYVCAQGPTALELTVTRTGEDLFATFAFGPLPENPTVPTGAFTMTGVVESRSVMLFPAAWLDRPERYVTVGLTGSVAPGEDVIFRGMVDTPTGRCKAFELHRVP